MRATPPKLSEADFKIENDRSNAADEFEKRQNPLPNSLSKIPKIKKPKVEQTKPADTTTTTTTTTTEPAPIATTGTTTETTTGTTTETTTGTTTAAGEISASCDVPHGDGQSIA